ncbi:NAD-specific glutamate dehydrogenase [Fusarium oxysporum f. sp. albedinis]|nr:NAD-specific glutamate dehydrogenase [Fusarium oxysporum f. sp. albedinis]
MANSADRVFHTLELAQQIVFELELKDFFRALSITKRLWESQVPNHVWEEHLMRLGYPLQAIRQTSYSLKTCYTRIS